MHEEVSEVIGKAWNQQVEWSRMFKIHRKLKLVKRDLLQWNKKVHVNAVRRITEIKDQLEETKKH